MDNTCFLGDSFSNITAVGTSTNYPVHQSLVTRTTVAIVPTPFHVDASMINTYSFAETNTFGKKI